jgi:hypothetical protein
MKIALDSLKGYLLEEMMAYLIKNTGYDLLVDEHQDPLSLRSTGLGLNIKGLGAEHQADVLGQLQWMPGLTYPMRMFVEAEFRSGKTGIKTVRNAVAVVNDLNQVYTKTRETNTPTKRHTYSYCVFSASGFSKSAVEMAMAHHISLVDVSGAEYEPLRSKINETAKNIHHSLGSREEGGTLNSGGDHRFAFIQSLREYLRRRLGTWTGVEDYESISLLEEKDPIFEILEELAVFVEEEYTELFAAVPGAPFLLVMKAEDPKAFRDYAEKYPAHRVHAECRYMKNSGIRWVIHPEEGKNYELQFLIPEQLQDLILNSVNPAKTALNGDRDYVSNLSVYSHSSEKDEIFRLEYNPLKINS